MDLGTRLLDVGLTDYQSRCIVAILKLGKGSAKSISRASNIPYSRIYSTLSELEAMRWVQKTDDRPALYYVSNIEELLEKYLLKQKKEINELKVSIRELSMGSNMEMTPTFSIRSGSFQLKETVADLAYNSREATMVIGSSAIPFEEIASIFSKRFVKTLTFVKKSIIDDARIIDIVNDMKALGDVRILPFTPPIILFFFDRRTFVVVLCHEPFEDVRYLVISNMDMGDWLEKIISIAYSESLPTE